MRGSLIAAVLAATLLAAAAPASSVTPVQRAALKALRQPGIDPATAAAGRAEVGRAAHLARTLPSGRREHVVTALGELASFAGRLTQPRAISLIGTLRANDDYFSRHYAPQPKTDITDADGIVYRYFAGRCFEFHPLANFGALNARVAAGDADGAKRLADALIARGVYRSGAGLGWEYTFPFAGGHAPWVSGMAQAVAAQAFARTAALVPEESTQLMRSAQGAYRRIAAGLLTSVAAGPWIRLYSFDSLPVLNAQLQTVVSLQSYATVAEDAAAGTLATRLQRAAALMLPRFDTGYWTYYALPNDPSPLDYQQFVVQLLRRLAPSDPRFADAAVRFARYEDEPAAFRLANGSLGTLRFWLSKPATVTAQTAAGPTRRVDAGPGWHTLAWPEPRRSGTYGVHVQATDWAGNKSAFDALPFVRVTTAKPAKGRAQSAAAAPAPPSFAVGAALDDPSQSASAQRRGLRLVRVGVPWPAGATAPDPAVVAALQRLAPGVGTVVELTASPLPADDPARAALAQYAAQLVAAVPSLRMLVLEPAVTAATSPSYLAALNALRGALPTAPLAAAIDGAADPRGSMGAIAGVPVDAYVLRPAPVAAKGAWTTAEVPLALSTLQSEYGAAPPLFVDGALPAAVPGLSCVPGLAGVLLDRLADASVAGVVAATRGTVVCPGLAASVTPAVQWPAQLDAGASLQLACDRSCLYLATLERGDGSPVVARRGALTGGAPPARVTLPKAKLAAGSYRLVVRLVSQVDPGAVTTVASEPLAPGPG